MPNQTTVRKTAHT